MLSNATDSQPLEIAVTAWMFGTGGIASELARQGEIAEKLGAHSFWLPENHFGDERSIPSPLMLLAAVAARTETLKLGSTSYLLPIRHPLQAAEEVAVLDRLSGGRVILGVGRGTQEAMFRAFDVETREKRKIFKSRLSAMIKAWEGEPVAHLESGEPVRLAPLPVQKPYPPIWVAAFGPLAIKQAGSLGLPYLASPVETLDKLEANYQSHRVHAADAGHELAGPVPVMRTIFVSENKRLVARTRQALRDSMAHAMREESASVESWTIIGDETYVRDRLDEYVERLGMTHLIARGRIPGIDNDMQVTSLERLMAIGTRVNRRS